MISKKIQILTILSILAIYSAIPFLFIKFEDKVRFEGDEIFFQSIAVNYANGHGFPKVGGIEDFSVYKFSLENVNKPYPSIELFKNTAGPYSFSKQPVYPLFIGLIYRISGINPALIKWLQLLMYIIVAAFLPLIGFLAWGRRGFYSGLLASPFYLFFNYNNSRLLYTEPLIVFSIFLIVLAYFLFRKRPGLISSMIIGSVLGFGLLLKGSLIFLPFLMFILLFFNYRKDQRFRFWSNISIVFLFFILPIITWTIYANKRNCTNVEKAKRSIEILTNKSLSNEYKRTFIDTSSLVFVNPRIFPPFLATAKNVRDAIASTSIPTEELPFYQDNSDIEEKLVWQKFYLSSNKFIVFSNQSSMLMIDGNCELYPNKTGMDGSNGGGNIGWGRTFSCSYYHDKMADSTVILRVIHFYLCNPGLILRNFYYKISLGLFRMMFLWVILFLLLLETIMNIFIKAFPFFSFWLTLSIAGVIYLSFFFSPPVLGRDSLLFYSILIAIILLLFVLNFKTRFKNISFRSMGIFNVIFINFIIISIVIFGFERQNNVISFILTLVAFNYLLDFAGRMKSKFLIN